MARATQDVECGRNLLLHVLPGLAVPFKYLETMLGEVNFVGHGLLEYLIIISNCGACLFKGRPPAVSDCRASFSLILRSSIMEIRPE
jgi:hypothetical protein